MRSENVHLLRCVKDTHAHFKALLRHPGLTDFISSPQVEELEMAEELLSSLRTRIALTTREEEEEL